MPDPSCSFKKIFCVLVALLVASLAPLECSRAAEVPAAAEHEAVYEHAVVAADHPLASQAGLEMLRRGGNVVDAAVATSFTLSVVRPESCGLGGGGFMVVWLADRQKAIALDYRERAPAAANEAMYQDPENPTQALPDLSTTGHLAVAVPGTVAGLCFVLEHHGTFNLPTVLEPALRYAREGFPADRHHVEAVNSTIRLFEKNPNYRQRFPAIWRTYLNEGRPIALGDLVHSPLEGVLELIALHGARGFYEGPVAEALAAEIQRGGGLITLDDLRGTRPVVRRAIEGQFRGNRLFTMPPPSSGGTALVEMFNLLETQRLDELEPGTPRYLHLLTESMKHAFADRARWLGDADFVDVPVDRLTSPAYARELAAGVDPNRTRPAEEYGSHPRGTGDTPVLPEDSGTSHFSVLDAQGNAVACTETINLTFGSKVIEPRFGIMLNNEMDDFTAVPGVPNAFGLIQSRANAVQPGKKPLSSMTPTVVVRKGRAAWVAGGSGGPRIISATAQVLLNGLLFGLTPEEAVAASRLHHQWQPNVLLLEPGLFDKVAEPMREYGHEVAERQNLAAVQAASRSQDGLRAASDPRKGGAPAGY